MSKQIFLKCDCGSEGVLVEYDETCGTFDVSVLAQHNIKKINWYNRIKVFLTGKLYHDQIVLNKRKAGELISFLSSNGADGVSVDTYTVDEANKS